MPTEVVRDRVEEVRVASGRRRSGVAFWCAVVLILVSVYIGAYYALLLRELGGRHFYRPGSPLRYSVGEWQPRYSSNDKVNAGLRQFFAPVYQADLKIRREYWNAPFIAP